MGRVLVIISLMKGSDLQMSNMAFISASDGHKIEGYELKRTTRVQYSILVGGVRIG